MPVSPLSSAQDSRPSRKSGGELRTGWLTVVAPPAAHERFQALDALRGICALCVAIFHYRAVSQGGLVPFAGNSWLFVDFFFVLSGFVIAAAYGDRLAGGFRTTDFLLLRLGRIYPLHLAVLLAMVAVELAALVLHHKGVFDRAPFTDHRSVNALFGSIGLIHIFGIWPGLVWNASSWSIAAELWTYGIFALACRFGRALSFWILLALAGGSVLILALGGDPWLDRTFSMSLFRCVYGFGLGVLAHRLHSNGVLRPASPAIAGMAEFAIIASCIVFVSLVASGALTLVAPIMFLLAVLIFSYEAGTVSRLLRVRVLQWLGLLSYSIYMIHTFVLGRLSDVYQLAQGRLGINLLGTCAYRAGADCFAAQGVLGAVTLALYVLLVMLGSWVGWQLIEEPSRRWSRRLVQEAAARRADAMTDRHAAF